MKISLGTAQFGMAYGVSNSTGQVQLCDVEKIIQLARDSGIRYIDTAVNYGDAERVLGTVGVSDFVVTSKLPPLPPEVQDIDDWVSRQIDGILERLKLAQIDTLLLHRSTDWGRLVYGNKETRFTELLKEGVVKKIGISAYSPTEVENVIEDSTLGSIQIPFNQIDQRLLDSGLYNTLSAKGIEIHIRSVFLQGLLLMSFGKMPEYFLPWANVFECWHRWLSRNDITAVTGCLSVLQEIPEITSAVIGVTSHGELEQIINAMKVTEEIAGNIDSPGIACFEPHLIEPSRWNI